MVIYVALIKLGQEIISIIHKKKYIKFYLHKISVYSYYNISIGLFGQFNVENV